MVPYHCTALSELTWLWYRVQARLAGGDWVPLLPEGHAGVPEVKWSPNRMRPFLCIGASADASPGEREAEEFIEARHDIPRRADCLLCA